MGVVGVVRLWLVRHGLTEWSSAGRFNGWTDVPLSEGGRAQARSLGARLKGRAFTGVWSSDLRRAADTAELAIGGAVWDMRLRELDFGEIEGRTWAECEPATQAALLLFDSFAAPRGESVADLYSRIRSFLGELGPGDHLVFTHAGVIRALLRAHDLDRPVGWCEVARLDLPGNLGPRGSVTAVEGRTHN